MSRLHRRSPKTKELRLVLFYKVVHQLVTVPANDILIKTDARSRSQNSLKYIILRASIDTYKSSFFPASLSANPTNVIIWLHIKTRRSPSGTMAPIVFLITRSSQGVTHPLIFSLWQLHDLCREHHNCIFSVSQTLHMWEWLSTSSVSALCMQVCPWEDIFSGVLFLGACLFELPHAEP